MTEENKRQPSCLTCKYAVSQIIGTIATKTGGSFPHRALVCVKRAPTADVETREQVFPVIAKGMWCGEWEEKVGDG